MTPAGRLKAVQKLPLLSNDGVEPNHPTAPYKKTGTWPVVLYGGEGGIRTLDRGLAYTPLAGERLQPLGHLTKSENGESSRRKLAA